MKQIGKKLGSVLLALCLMLLLLPTVAFAADASGLESTIESYTGGTGATGSLSASVSGSTVTVTGTITNASSTLTLNIDSGVTMIWQASITAASNFSGNLIELPREGTFEVADGGTVSTTLGNAIWATNNTTSTVIVSGGVVSTGKDYGYAINADNVKVSGGLVSATTGYAVCSYNVEENGGSVSATTGYAIYAVSTNPTVDYTVTVTGGTVSADNGFAIKADIVMVEGGTVSATGNNGCAIYATGSSVTVSGGTVSADNRSAINTISYIDCTVTISGGMVTSFSYIDAAILALSDNSTVTVSGGVVLSYGDAIGVTGDFTGPTGDGVVISWDQNADSTLYITGAASDLTVLPEGAASWATQSGLSGIAYTNGSNSGFIAVNGVTVAASMTEAADTVASAITSYSSNLQTSVNDSAITVTGSAKDVDTTLALNIAGGISVQWKASITAADTLTDNLIDLSGHGSFEVADGGTVSSAHSAAIDASGNVTVSGGTVSSVDGFAIIPRGNITVSGGTIRSLNNLAISDSYLDIDDLTITGGTIFFSGIESYVAYYSSAQSGDSVIIAWDQSAGSTQYDIGSSTDLAVSPATATVTWIKQGGVCGISYANGSNTGFIAVDGVMVEKTSVTVDKLSFTDLSTLQLMYNGTPQGIGTVTAADGFALGTITVYYTGINGTTYIKSTTAPTNAGTYQVTADVAGNVNYEAASNLVLGEYTINKATAAGVSQNYAVLVNSAQEYTFDLTTLLPSGVDASQVSAYTITGNTNNNGIFSGECSISGTSLTLAVNSVATAGLSDTVTIGFTSENYDIGSATITFETTDKTPVTISADMTGGVYNGQPYAYSNAAVTNNTDGSNVTSSVTLDTSYEGVDSTSYGPSATAPTNAGSYQLTLSVPNTDATYTGSAVYTFTIAKRPVTVKADDKSVTVGSDPVFTYTVDGQLSGETALIGEPGLTFAAGNTSKAGSYTIDVVLTGVSYTDNYMAANPAYVNGTLTVSTASPGGNTPPSGGGSSTPSTPAPTVSGSTATTTATAKTGSDGKATASVTQSQMSTAITAAQKAAASTGEAPRVEIQISGGSDTSAVETTLPIAAVQALVTGEMETLTLSSNVADITFDAQAIAAIAGASTGDVNISAAQVENSTLSGAAAQVVGNRPVYHFSVTSGGNTISEFDGNVTVSIPYTPADGEDTNAIVAYYINANGEPELMQNCYYDAKAGTLVFTTTHFSTYAVGYNKVSFTDVSDNAWYADAIAFLAARQITSGTTENTFSPDATLTRGQFITLLLRAYGIDADNSTADNFADAGNTYYTGYLAAAKRLGITNGVGDNKFAPEQAVTRQDMFTLLYNALRAIDQLPEENSGATLSDFADSESISAYAQEAMSYLIKTGVVSGNNGQLSPTATTTRAQMAQVLYNLLSK